jgi:hypothetical protein
MAKKLDLRTWLVESRLFFLPKGIYAVSDILETIKEIVPHLCDDTILCTHSGNTLNTPEWKHSVRWALHELQKLDIVESVGDGYWKKKTKHN